MAARENQGLQVAVIIFAILTIVLAVTTYIFYAKSDKATKEKAAAVAQAESANQQRAIADYKVAAYQYVLGMGGVTKEKVDQLRPPTAQQDVDELLRAYEADMAMIADQVAADGARNYRVLPTILLGVIQKKNSSVVDANDLTTKAQADKDANAQAEAARVAAATAAQAKADADLANERKSYSDERTRMDGEKNKLATVLADKDKRHKAELDKVSKEHADLLAQNTQYKTTIDLKTLRLDELEKEQVNLFESPDGKITWVNQRQRLVWINVGKADGLLRQTSFSVFDHDINGVANAKSKARIEVVRIADDHLAECRILEDSASNPILVGDVIHTPSWSPGQRIHFALAGFMDIDGDRTNDFDLIKSIITMNGGVVDAELTANGVRKGAITVNTRYIVLGDTDRGGTSDTDNKFRSEYTAMRNEADRYGTETIALQKLLSQMGWKVEERTVELQGIRGGSEFRTRKPGQKGAPTAPGAAEAAPAEGAPAEGPPMPMPPGNVDPFATPEAAAPGAAAPVDPFAAPDAGAAAPMPKAADADPFADPK